MNDGTRIGLAVIVSPLAALLPLGFFAATEALIFPTIGYGPEGWFLVAVFAMPIAYIAVGTVGVGTHFLFRRLGIGGVWRYVLVGATISAIPGAAILLSGASGDDRIYPVLFLACAMASSFAFGAIVRGSSRTTEPDAAS